MTVDEKTSAVPPKVAPVPLRPTARSLLTQSSDARKQTVVASVKPAPQGKVARTKLQLKLAGLVKKVNEAEENVKKVDSIREKRQSDAEP